MKHILITGANSYIGTAFEQYIRTHYPESIAVDTIDMIDGGWRSADFSGYDAIFHVAGIAHSDNGRISPERAKLYYDVNCTLAIEVAEKAREEGVGQFIFMSSAIVYGNSAPIGKRKHIDHDTPVSPANAYGDSKVQAERGLLPLSSDTFRVCILRPPMIYGKGSRGNYPILSRLAQRVPLFPYVKNERSMLYIEHLCEFVRLMIEHDEAGIFWPQNNEYSRTSELVRSIGLAHHRRVRLVRGFGWLLKLISLFVGLVNKAFGNLTYDRSLSEYREPYAFLTLDETIQRTETETSVT